jgi:hypothetical protein
VCSENVVDGTVKEYDVAVGPLSLVVGTFGCDRINIKDSVNSRAKANSNTRIPWYI